MIDVVVFALIYQYITNTFLFIYRWPPTARQYYREESSGNGVRRAVYNHDHFGFCWHRPWLVYSWVLTSSTDIEGMFNYLQYVIVF